MLTLVAFLTVCTTLLGGYVAFLFKDKLHLILGFSAGAVIGVAFFDLIPEAFELAEGLHDVHTVALMIGIGFLTYLFLDRAMGYFFAHGTDQHAGHIHVEPRRGALGATALSFHSLLDGVVIGIAFQASAGVGLVVALAVLVHDFSDGINTVTMVLKHGGKNPLAWLVLDALAPLVGIALTLVFVPPAELLPLFLGAFAGFFLYIGASDLIPESHHAHPKLLTTVMTLLGAFVLYAVIAFAH